MRLAMTREGGRLSGSLFLLKSGNLSANSLVDLLIELAVLVQLTVPATEMRRLAEMSSHNNLKQRRAQLSVCPHFWYDDRLAERHQRQLMSGVGEGSTRE